MDLTGTAIPRESAFNILAANTSEAAHVLDGLLYHDTGLAIEEHYTDTGGVSTDYTFTKFRKRILTQSFAPRAFESCGQTGLEFHAGFYLQFGE